LFGSPAPNKFLSKVDNDRSYKLAKCEVGLFNNTAYQLFYDFEILKHSAKHLQKEQSGRAFEYLQFATKLANQCHVPFDLDQQEQSHKLAQDFFQRHKNSSTQH